MQNVGQTIPIIIVNAVDLRLYIGTYIKKNSSFISYPWYDGLGNIEK